MRIFFAAIFLFLLASAVCSPLNALAEAVIEVSVTASPSPVETPTTEIPSCQIAISESDAPSLRAVGDPLAMGGEGRVYTFVSNDTMSLIQVLQPSFQEEVRSFGESLVFIRDITGDQKDDLVVAAPGDTAVSMGVVTVYTSSIVGEAVQYLPCGSIAGAVGFGSQVGQLVGENEQSIVTVNSLDGSTAYFTVSLAISGLCQFDVYQGFAVEPTGTDTVVTSEPSSCPDVRNRSEQSESFIVEPIATENSNIATASPIVTSIFGEATPVASPEPSLTPTQIPTPVATGEHSPEAIQLPESTPDPFLFTETPSYIEIPDEDQAAIGHADNENTLVDQSEVPIQVAPGSSGLPAPRVVAEQGSIIVHMPTLVPELTTKQKRRAARRLYVRAGISRQRALKLLSNPQSYRIYYEVQYSEVASSRHQSFFNQFTLINSAYAAPQRRRVMRKKTVRSRNASIALRNLRPGATYQVSYRAQLTMRKFRIVLGATKLSPSVIFEAPQRI